MKRLLSLFVFVITLSNISVSAGEDRPIPPDQLPSKVKMFLNTHFPKEQIALAKMEKEFLSTEYKIYLVGGNKIEFGKDLEWKEIDCEYTEVPESVVPKKINEFIRINYPGKKIVQIEKKDKKKKRYEVELDNSMEIQFDANFSVVDIDY